MNRWDFFEKYETYFILTNWFFKQIDFQLVVYYLTIYTVLTNSLRVSNFKTKKAMSVKFSEFVISVKVIIYF